MIYRGQLYGEAIGEWWTTSAREAENFATSRGANWIVLSVAEDDLVWLSQYLKTYTHKFENEEHRWYRIPVFSLRERWLGVKIHNGAISLNKKGTD